MTPPMRAVILGDANSVFVTSLARAWIARGVDVAVVTRYAEGKDLPPEVDLVRAEKHDGRVARRLVKTLRPPLERFEARVIPRYRERFVAATGKPAPDPWEWRVVEPLIAARPLAAAVARLRPRFVFAEEALAYGPAAVHCRSIPFFLMPWGSDVFNSPFTSPLAMRTVRRALHASRLVVPTAEAAARFIVARFGVPRERVRAVSWGVDVDRFRAATGERRAAICAAWGLDPARPVVVSPRKFAPHWGSRTILDALLAVATTRDDAQFVILGGRAGEAYTEEARRRIGEAGLADRFRISDSLIDLDRYADVMSIATIFLSLVARGDMRSSTVLQGAACGAAPVIGRTEEYEIMAEEGFLAGLVEAADTPAVVAATLGLLDDDEGRERIVRANRSFIERNEDAERQMDALLRLLLEHS